MAGLANRFGSGKSGNFFCGPIEEGDTHLSVDRENAVGDAVKDGSEVIEVFTKS
jgi:hypothetical protein